MARSHQCDWSKSKAIFVNANEIDLNECEHFLKANLD